MLWPNHALQRTASPPSGQLARLLPQTRSGTARPMRLAYPSPGFPNPSNRASREVVSARCAPPAPPRPSPSLSLAPIERTVKSSITLCVLTLVLAACCHVEPERRSTESEIRQNIVGEWTLSDKSDGSWFPTMILGEDGRLIVVRIDGTRALLGSWTLDRTALRVTRTPTSDSAARASAMLLNEWDYLPVIFVDERELVMTGGFSVAGRLKFTK